MATHARKLTMVAVAIAAILITAFSVRSLTVIGTSVSAQSDHKPVVIPPATTPTPQPPAEPTPKQEKLVPYTGPIENIFFHPLIAYPELAFDNDSLSRGYDDWFVTVPEFRKILDALYKNNYILISINDVFEERTEGGKPMLTPKHLLLPEGKKPLILSIDDLNYYQYMRENGNVYKLILDSEQRIATYSVTPQGRENIKKSLTVSDRSVKSRVPNNWLY